MFVICILYCLSTKLIKNLAITTVLSLWKRHVYPRKVYTYGPDACILAIIIITKLCLRGWMFTILLLSSEQGSNPFHLCPFSCMQVPGSLLSLPLAWTCTLTMLSVRLHALSWWLGLDTLGGSSCPFWPDIALDPLGHHAASCRHGGDVVSWHNHLHDICADFCRCAHLSVKVEVGY